MLSFTIVLFAHRSNYSFCRKRLLSLVFGAFLLDLLCCHTTLSANQRLTAGTYTAEFDYDVVGTLAAARYDEVDILYKLPDRIGNIYPDRFGKEATYERGGRRKEDKEWTYHFDGEGFLTQRVSKTESIERYDWIRRKLLTEPLTWTYEWDGAGQLIAVSNNEQKDMGGQPVRLRFEYDDLGRRTAKISVWGRSAYHRVTRFLWDGDECSYTALASCYCKGRRAACDDTSDHADSSYINPLHYACRRVANCRSWSFPPSPSLPDEDDRRSVRETIAPAEEGWPHAPEECG